MKKIFTIIICICAITAQAQKAGNEAIRKLQMAEFAIANLYVDSVDENKLVEEAIIKMLAQLDPHSTYNDAEEVKMPSNWRTNAAWNTARSDGR